jgi:hypothetical protein
LVVENFDEAEVNHEIVRRPTLDTNCDNPPDNDFPVGSGDWFFCEQLSIRASAIRPGSESFKSSGDKTMRFMIIIKASQDSEAGIMPSTELLTAMGNYNEELAKAGILLAGEGLHPSSKGARVRFSGDKRTVIDGPFAETKELIAGYWLWQVKSREEAVEWVKRCPNPMPGTEAEIEIRQVFELEDFGAELTPELREQEERAFGQGKKC